MANQEQLEILKQGVEEWNEWRKLNPHVALNLSGANLRGAFLHEANLSDTDLTEADLSEANLNSADLSNAQLNFANLRGASLFYANLHGANFNKANLRWARLNSSNLTGASLYDADLSKAHLDGADFTHATVGLTTFANNDLSVVRGLEDVYHRAASFISIDTLYKSQGRIPEVFLRGAGVPDSFLIYIPTLTGSERPVQFYSCFISYSTKDELFARRLHSDLQSVGIRCWFAPQDMKIGDKLGSSINEAIRFHDKLILILSEHAIGSKWVELEVENALKKELEQNRLVLFPIRLDDTVFQASASWAVELRARHIEDFHEWKEPTKYQRSIARIVRDLKASLATESVSEEQGHES